MEINDPKIIALKQAVIAAQQEYDMAITFHEVWRPAAYDADLHARIGRSYATHAFLVTRLALRRERLLALLRPWDTNKQAVRMTLIAATLDDKDVIQALAVERARQTPWAGIVDTMKADLEAKATEVINLVRKYQPGGVGYTVLKNLTTLRNERLAHRQLVESETADMGASATDNEIEEFYKDTSTLIHKLLGLVNAIHYEPVQTAEIFRKYAAHFWAGARGERTEGHPDYRPRPHIPVSP